MPWRPPGRFRDERPRLRPEEPEDDDFLFALFAQDAIPPLHRADLDEAGARQLARMQHRSRSAGYRGGGGRFSIATLDGTPVGRLVARREPDRLYIVDLAISAAWRRRGLASALLHRLIAQARKTGRSVTLHVGAMNVPALALYDKHGFTVVGEASSGLMLCLEPSRTPETVSA